MELIASLLLIIGFFIALIYGIKLLILAFKTSILWGLAYLFVPFASIIFIIVHWDEAGSPFLRGLLSIPFVALGLMLMAPYITPAT